MKHTAALSVSCLQADRRERYTNSSKVVWESEIQRTWSWSKY